MRASAAGCVYADRYRCVRKFDDSGSGDVLTLPSSSSSPSRFLCYIFPLLNYPLLTYPSASTMPPKRRGRRVCADGIDGIDASDGVRKVAAAKS